MIALLQENGLNINTVISAGTLCTVAVLIYRLGDFAGELKNTLKSLRVDLTALKADIKSLEENDREQSKTLAHHGETLAVLTAMKAKG
jgi:hypothetical protein